MGYGRDFYSDFFWRTLQIVKHYEGPYGATLLINCLLGLLVVPEEKKFESLPEDSLENLTDWGISPDSIIKTGQPVSRKAKYNPETIKGLVVNLRHSIAHFTIVPIQRQGQVESFLFHNDSGFVALIPLEEMKIFVEKLAESISICPYPEEEFGRKLPLPH